MLKFSINELIELGKIKMIRCHLAILLAKRKVKISEVARELGIHRNALTLLYNETATRIDLNIIDQLCEYFDCELSDLLEYVPNNKEE